MKLYVCLLWLALVSCTHENKSHNYSIVQIEKLYSDSISIRAIELMDGSLAFAANKGRFGSIDLATKKVRTNVMRYDSILPDFRAVAHTATDFFMLSAGNPALLYKTGDNGAMSLVYKEEGEGVFYDAMKFWNTMEGIAIGDSMEGCLSVIITRDGGFSWTKLPCGILPKSKEGEGAFAASNTNLDIVGDKTWIGTTSSRILYSGNKGNSWQVTQVPIVNQEDTQGIYTLDFYDETYGAVFGGDYTNAEANLANKAITTDGGATWNLVADGSEPGYKSCVQFIPNAGGEDLVALGFTGISYSNDRGVHWKLLSNESFYTLRFANDSVAYAAGRNQIAKLTFRRNKN